MNADHFYDWMKNMLDFFDIDWKDKHKLKLQFKKDKVIASYGRETVTYDVSDLNNE
jgi:hypothetical protein